MKIYTKVGDDGSTRLHGGGKVRKDDARVAAYGGVDELNSAVGLAISLARDPADAARLAAVQDDLFVLGADLATPPGTRTAKTVPRVNAARVQRLEKEIDAMQADLPPLKNFILPGGGPAGAALHLARSVCRRAERDLVRLIKTQKVARENQIYLNRLSDWLFVLARRVNRADGRAETPWHPEKT